MPRRVIPKTLSEDEMLRRLLEGETFYVPPGVYTSPPSIKIKWRIKL